MRYNCIEIGHLWLEGLDKCGRCGEQKHKTSKPEREPEQDYDIDGYTW
jgi:hypothetical protein